MPAKTGGRRERAFQEEGLRAAGLQRRVTHHTLRAGGWARSRTRGASPARRGRAARDPRRARGGKDRGGLSGPHSRGLYDTALARGTGRGWLRRRRPLHAIYLSVSLARNSREK